MKKLLLLFIVLISWTSFGQVSWTEQFTAYPVSGSYTGDISIVDANTIWTLVQPTSTTNHQTFSKTTNGGATWTSGSINIGNTTMAIANISAVDANTAWVAVYPNATSTPITAQGIYKTTNGGTTWTKQTTAAFGSASFVNFVHFWDANNGVCMGDKQGGYWEVYTTTNGGTNWTRTNALGFSASTGDYGYTGKFYVKGNTIWFGTDNGELMRSVNKGLNWTKITTPITDFGGGTDTTSIAEFAFANDSNGFILKETYSGTTYTGLVLYKTTNGGSAWTTVTPGTGIFHGSIDFAGTGMLVTGGSTTGNFGSSYSLDNGLTWTNIDALSHTCLKFFSDSVGFGGGFATATTGGAFKFNNTLSNTNFDQNRFVSYPNPAKDFITVSNSDNVLLTDVNITDLNGRTVKTLKVENLSEVEINISDLNSGIYLMNITSDEGKSVKKFIKN